LVEQARKSLSRLSKPGKEVKEQIDTFEDNYNDIDELLRQFMPQELVKEGKRQEFKEFANRIIDFNKDIGFQAYEKVKLCSSMAPGKVFDLFLIKDFHKSFILQIQTFSRVSLFEVA